MRHRSDAPESSTTGSNEIGSSTTTIDQDSGARPVVPGQPRAEGKHRAPATPRIPRQKVPEREPVAPKPADATVPVPSVPVPTAQVTTAPETGELPFVAPRTARWRASHAPRMLAGVLLLLAVGGTSALGLDYQQNPGRDQLISLAIGIAVVVCLWAMLIASTPQVVSLRGSVLTIHNSSGTERFDLDDGQQPVDLVGEPGSSKWALVLHRANRTALVLRRRDVDAVQLDPIVRHYRKIARRKHAERQARFDR